MAVRNTAFPREAALQAKVVPGRGRAGGHLVPHAPLPLAWRAGALAGSELQSPPEPFQRCLSTGPWRAPCHGRAFCDFHQGKVLDEYCCKLSDGNWSGDGEICGVWYEAEGSRKGDLSRAGGAAAARRVAPLRPGAPVTPSSSSSTAVFILMVWPRGSLSLFLPHLRLCGRPSGAGPSPRASRPGGRGDTSRAPLSSAPGHL